MTHHIQTKTLQAISLFAESRGARKHLQGVLVEQYDNGQIALLATDGHVLGGLWA